MKRIALVLFSTMISSQGWASAKVCFGSTKSYVTKGAVMTAMISEDNIVLKTVTETPDFAYEGTFTALNDSIEGKDGKTYLTFAGRQTDYNDVIMVDQELLKDATTGLLQIRARGEGFFNDVFVCRDDEQAVTSEPPYGPIAYADFKTKITKDLQPVLAAQGCTTSFEEVRDTFTVKIRKGGRNTVIEFSLRDQIQYSLVEKLPGAQDSTWRYQTSRGRDFIEFTHEEFVADTVTINLGGRATFCRAAY